MIVHNCVQAVARDVLMEGLLNLDMLGQRTVLRVHDEAAVEQPEDRLRPELVRQCMTEIPAWAHGLPVEAGEPVVSRRYGKG